MPAPLLALVLAAAPKLAVLPVAAGEGIPASTAAALTEALTGEVRRRAALGRLEAAAFLEPRWRRIPHALARDDEGTSWCVDEARAAAWPTGAARKPLSWLEPSDHGPLIYGDPGVCRGEPLGTPRDGRL
jgi:hypothetical protein